MTLKQEALDFIGRLQTLYFERRDMSALLPAMEEHTSWIGTGAQEICVSLEDAETALSLERQEYAGHFTVIKKHFEVRVLSEDVCVVYGDLTAHPDDAAIADLYNRLTAVCVRTPQGMRLAHLHMSSPDADLEDDHFYVKQDTFGQRETLRLRAKKATEELKERNCQLEALTENIPGGVHQCACDEDLTFLSMSQSFLTLVGYTHEEIRQQFHNHFAEMIYPSDRARINGEMAEQLSRGDSLELEYRILRGDGQLLWILDQGKRAVLPDGSPTFFCMLMDITKQKQQREELRLLLERHQIIMDQTTDIIFEWDIIADTLTFSANWRKKFGYDPVRENISQKIPLSSNIHPDDMPAFMSIMRDAATGIGYSETEFRIRDIREHFTWSRIRATVQYDLHGRPIKAVGVILDIDADKRQKEQLIVQAQRDALTDLYNKATVQELVERKMQESSVGKDEALLIIDVDCFKRVNDTYGHLCGDALLSNVAGVLKSRFRAGDIVGRIGGDEFLVFLPEIVGRKEAAAKTQDVLDALKRLRPIQNAPSISCSIGIALFPQKSMDYYTLYKCADLALYQMKNHGKGSFAFYDPQRWEGNLSSDLAQSAVGAIDSGGDIE